MPLAIAPGARLLFTGDSITDCGRRDEHPPLGNGYVRHVESLLAARHPACRPTLLNTGIGGNTAANLADRWTDDVVRHQPDWLTILVGINDLHRHLRGVDEPVSPEEYARHYDGILGRARAETSAKLVLIEPFYISVEARAGTRRRRVLDLLPTYTAIVRDLASRYETRFVAAHDAYQAALAHHPGDLFCPEPVHPNPNAGHLLLANAWLDAVGG